MQPTITASDIDSHYTEEDFARSLKGMNMNITPFQFENHQLRVITDDQGMHWFNATDVCDALEMGNPSQAIKSHVDAEDLQKLETLTAGGRQRQNHVNESGLYALILGSTKDEAKKFKRWVTSDVLPSIRKTGTYSAPAQSAKSPSATDAMKMIPIATRAARALGLDKNAAAISANQAVAKLTGTNVMQLLGATHIESQQQVLFFTPTELGKNIGVSGRGMNMLLAEAGLQAKHGEHWTPLPAAEGFCRIMDTGKRHGDGTMIQQVKWAEGVLSLVEKAA